MQRREQPCLECLDLHDLRSGFIENLGTAVRTDESFFKDLAAVGFAAFEAFVLCHNRFEKRGFLNVLVGFFEGDSPAGRRERSERHFVVEVFFNRDDIVFNNLDDLLVVGRGVKVLFEKRQSNESHASSVREGYK